MTKQKIREKLSKKRSELTKVSVNEKSRIIHKRLISTKEFKEAKAIMFYISKDNEVRTNSSIELALSQSKTVCIPCTDKRTHSIQPFIIDSSDDVVEGNYCILEPKKRDIAPKIIDLAVIPGVAFDNYGHRLGRGKAYYDKFLKDTVGVLKIGLAFDFQIVSKLPIDSHDIPMDIIITEKRTITRK